MKDFWHQTEEFLVTFGQTALGALKISYNKRITTPSHGDFIHAYKREGRVPTRSLRDLKMNQGSVIVQYSPFAAPLNLSRGPTPACLKACRNLKLGAEITRMKHDLAFMRSHEALLAFGIVIASGFITYIPRKPRLVQHSTRTVSVTVSPFAKYIVRNQCSSGDS